jgi:(2Fe-2S) ferredoxin
MAPDAGRRRALRSVPMPRLPGDPSLHFDNHVFVCCNRRPDGHPRGSCAARGSEKLRDYMKARAKELGLVRVRINASGCLDRCEKGPCVVIYPDGVWYHVERPEDVEAVLLRHVAGGGRVPGLMLREDAPAP